MEHTGRQTAWKSGRFQSRPRSGTRLLHAALLFLFAFLVGRTPFLGEYFPAAVALTACLASRNPIYIYLAIPAGAGIFCCIRTGVDAWSELIAVCWLLRMVESGLILGVDNYCLFLAVAAFAAVSWKCSSLLRRMIGLFSGSRQEDFRQRSQETFHLLQRQEEEMKTLAELYDTYVDSRSLLAAQFGVTSQMLEHTRWQMEQALKKRYTKQGKEPFLHEKFQMDIAVSQCAATGTINGDCCGWQDLGDGRTALVISDGMGKGKRAAAESLLVTRTVLGLLKSGAGTELTLKMINTIMMMKDGEDSFATVDLAVVDRRSGRTKFYKIGAAPTLIRRRNNIEEVRLSAVPLGIVNGLEIRSEEIFLKKGDFLIMMSDGVSDGPDGRGFLPQLAEILRSIRSGEPAVICDLVLDQVSDSYLGKERDDLTIMTAKLL